MVIKMKKRDLFKLIPGVYKVKDTLYTYKMEVFKSKRGHKFFIFSCIGYPSEGTFSLTESEIKEYSETYERTIKYKALLVTAKVGYIYIHSYDSFSILYNLKFISRGSFSKFVEETKKII
jgi:hypothetical protein